MSTRPLALRLKLDVLALAPPVTTIVKLQIQPDILPSSA
jgi:hypothetical protein